MFVEFKNLVVWRLAYNFTLKIYKVVEPFPAYEDGNIKSQLRRAATSLPLNISEGSGANSAKMFMTYLIFAYRSTKELETLLLLSKDLGYLTREKFEEVLGELNLVSEKLREYMDNLQNNYILKGRNKAPIHIIEKKKRLS